MVFKKILWTFKRHPFLYLTRFRLLSRNSNEKEIEAYSYNIKNSKEDIPQYFYEVNDIIFKDFKPSSELEIVKDLSIWLVDNIKGGPGLSVPSEEALRIMLSGKGGVCSDMVQIFNNFCVINDIKVREWGVTRAPFDRNYGGHSFSEIYCSQSKSWIMIDVSYCSLFYANEKTNPISVLEFYKFIRDDKGVHYKSFHKNKKTNHLGLRKNYFVPNTAPFLICNYSNKIYDNFLRFLPKIVPVFIVHFMVFILFKSYHYKFPLDDYKRIFS